jgi:uroporphyrin-III C-methyltransferase
MSRIASLTASLLDVLSASTPAAVVQNAGSSQEKRLVTTLDRLAEEATAAGLGSPAVILIGGAIGEAAEFTAHAVSAKGFAHAA